MSVNKNFPNYDKTKPKAELISRHPPGPNRHGRRADVAWKLKEPMREIRQKRDALIVRMREERVKKDRAKWEMSQDKKLKKTRHD